MEILGLSLQDMAAAFGSDAFRDVFSGTTVKRYREDGKTQVFFPSNLIQIRNGTFAGNDDSARWVISHEFGHRWDAKNRLSLSSNFEAAMGGRTTGSGCGTLLGEVLLNCAYDPNGDTVGNYAASSRREDFADTFAATVFGGDLANVVFSEVHGIRNDALIVAADRIEYLKDLIQTVMP